MKLSSCIVGMLAAASVAHAHMKSTVSLHRFYCQKALSSYNFDCGKTASCQCMSAPYIASLMDCIGVVSDHNQHIVEREMDIVGEKCVKMGMSNMGYTKMKQYYDNATFVDAANAVKSADGIMTDAVRFDTPQEVGFDSNYNETFEYMLYTGTLYGGIIMAYWAAVLALATLFNFLPSSYNIFTHTKLLKKYVSSYGATNRLLGIIPSRSQTIILIGYFIMNLVLCLVHYRFIPVFEEKKFQLCRHIADRTGIISFAHFPVVFLFAARNNLFITLTGWSFGTFNTYHRWVSRMMVLHAVIHSFAWTAYTVMDGEYPMMFGTPYWDWGVAATVFGGVIMLFSIRPLRLKLYEYFLASHIILAIFYTVGCVWHSYRMGWMQWIWASIAIWAFDRFVRFAYLAKNGFLFASPVTKSCTPHILKMSIEYPEAWRISTYQTGGLHYFIHFLEWNKWFQSHPFTLYPDPQAPQTRVILLAKVHNGITKSISDSVLSDSTLEPRLVGLDGPYGPFHSLSEYSQVLLVAGGIGITAIYNYAMSLLAHQTAQVVWIARDDSVLTWFADELKALEAMGISVRLIYTRMDASVAVSEIEAGQSDPSGNSSSEEIEEKKLTSMDAEMGRSRPDIGSIIHEYFKPSEAVMGAVVVCGPRSLVDDVHSSVRDETRISVVDEGFGW